MEHHNLKSLDTQKVEREIKWEQLLRVLTAIVIVLTIFQVGMANLNKSGTDALLGTFGSLIVVLSTQAKHIEQSALLVILSLVCLIRVL